MTSGSLSCWVRGAGAAARLAALCLGIGALADAATAAEDEIASHRSGPYLTVSAGAAVPNFETDYFYTAPPFGARDKEKTSLEVIGRAGWRVLPYLAIEGQYEWIKEWKLETKSSTCGKLDAQIFTGNVRLLAPFDVVHPYLVGGAGAGLYDSRVIEREFDEFRGRSNKCAVTQNVDLDEEEWELAVRLGGGFDVYLTRHVIFNFEVSTIYSDGEQFGEPFPFVSISGGLGYRF